MNVIGNQGIPSIANVIDQYVKSGNPFAGNALNLQSAVPQANVPTLDVGNPLAVESSSSTEETNPFKMKPKKGRLHAPLAERTGDKYLDIGNRYGNLASQAITGMYNKDIDDANAKIDADYTNYLIDRQKKADARQEAADTDFIDSEDYYIPGFKNWEDVITDPNEKNTVKNLKALMQKEMTYNKANINQVKAARALAKQKASAKEQLDKIFAKYSNSLMDLGKDNRTDRLDKFSFDKPATTQSRNDNRIDLAVNGLHLPVLSGINTGIHKIAANLTDNFGITNGAKERVSNDSALTDLARSMNKDYAGYKLDINKIFTRDMNIPQEIKEIMRPNDYLVNLRDPVTGSVKLLLISNGQTKDVTEEIAAKSYQDDLDRNANAKVWRNKL